MPGEPGNLNWERAAPMELSALTVSSCDFRLPASRVFSSAPRSCCTRNAGAPAVKTHRTASKWRAKLGSTAFSNAGWKSKVGAMAGALWGQRMGVIIGSGARWTASTWLDNS